VRGNSPDLIRPQRGQVPSVPTYDYQCRQCGRTTEVIHSMLEDGPTTCEHCGGPLRQVLHPAGIIFKGSGFYRNDSRTATGGGSERKAAPKSEKNSEGGGASGDGSASADKATTGAESSSAPSKE
jgi:putative FmdB family regulatory protein